MRRLAIQLTLLLCAHAAHAQDAATPAAQPAPAESAPVRAKIMHVPLNEALLGKAALTFDVRDAQLAGVIVVHLVEPGTAKPAQLEALRGAQGYEVEIPEELVAPPGFAYFVTERMPDGSERAVFADAASPHPVRVTRPRELEDELARLAARDGQRSKVIISGDVVDFGDRHLGSSRAMHDRYYRIEAGYAYYFLTRVESVQLSLVRVRGEGAAYSSSGSVVLAETFPGIDYGRAEVTLLAQENIRLRGTLALGASQRGFEYGGGGAVVIGDASEMSLELGIEGLTTLGTTGRLRLGFPALPRVPMGAAIEITSFPDGDDSGVRLLYDVGYRFGPVTQLTIRAGYQGRTSVTGGPAAGLTFDYGF